MTDRSPFVDIEYLGAAAPNARRTKFWVDKAGGYYVVTKPKKFAPRAVWVGAFVPDEQWAWQSSCVEPPNRLERWLGRTHESKLADKVIELGLALQRRKRQDEAQKTREVYAAALVERSGAAVKARFQ